MMILDGDATAPFSTLRISHSGKPDIIVSVAQLNKPDTIDTADIFKILNDYFATLASSRQLEIYETYVEIVDIMRNVWVAAIRKSRLLQQVEKLYQNIQYDEIVYHVKHKQNMSIPPSVRDRFSDVEISGRDTKDDAYRQRTYLREDYRQLVYLAVALKPMLPIWGEYLIALKNDELDAHRRELASLDILANTNLLTLPAIDKLKAYVDAIKPTNAESMSAVIGGLGTDEIPDWLLSIVLLRKITVVQLSSNTDSNNLMSVVFSGVMNAIRSMDRKFAGRVRARDKPSGTDENEDKDILSTYRIKEGHPIGDLIQNDIFVSDTSDIIRRLVSGDKILPDVEERALSSIPAMIDSNYRLTEPQMTILQWSLMPVISPLSVDNTSYKSLISLVAAVQTMLMSEGLSILGLLMTAIQSKDDDGYLIGGTESRNRTTREDIEYFSKTHPYYHAKGGKSPVGDNIAIAQIESVSKHFYRSSWKLLGYQDHARYLTLSPDGTYTCSNALKAEISSLLKIIDVRNAALAAQIRERGY